MLHALLVVLYVIVSVFLILVVLLQTGKRADLAGAFGGGGSQTALGTRGAANLLTKLTTVSAVLFMIIALSLSILTTRRAGSSGSVLEEVPGPPAAPASGGGAEMPPAVGDQPPTDGTPQESPAGESPIDASGDGGDGGAAEAPAPGEPGSP